MLEKVLGNYDCWICDLAINYLKSKKFIFFYAKKDFKRTFAIKVVRFKIKIFMLWYFNDICWQKIEVLDKSFRHELYERMKTGPQYYTRAWYVRHFDFSYCANSMYSWLIFHLCYESLKIESFHYELPKLKLFQKSIHR